MKLVIEFEEKDMKPMLDKFVEQIPEIIRILITRMVNK